MEAYSWRGSLYIYTYSEVAIFATGQVLQRSQVILRGQARVRYTTGYRMERREYEKGGEEGRKECIGKKEADLA